MYKLNTNFTDDEKMIIGIGYKVNIIEEIHGEVYILGGIEEYYYNQCFTNTDIEFFKSQKYEKATPYRAIKFYHYYLFEVSEEKGIWYCGRKDANGNFELTHYSETLEDAIVAL